MSKNTRTSHPLYNLLPVEVEGFDSLAELALDLHWSWNHAADDVWRLLDPAQWELTHTPGAFYKRSHETRSIVCLLIPFITGLRLTVLGLLCGRAGQQCSSLERFTG